MESNKTIIESNKKFRVEKSFNRIQKFQVEKLFPEIHRIQKFRVKKL